LPGTILLLLACSACTGGPEDAAPGERPAKSVLVGELIAIFPGLFVHGLGHRYAGATERADELLTMEIYSLLVGGLGGALIAIGETQDAEAVTIAGYVAAGVAAVPFLGTWFYDMVYTPSEVKSFNRRAQAPE
jgi:hypothetical protein